MRVRRKHFGRMCRCTKCKYPIYVTYDNVTPPASPFNKDGPRFFSEENVPIHWKRGDLLMETYEVRGTLGRGGMGIVYRVYHRGWGTYLAVKSPTAKLLSSPGWIETFEHECETWINLRPHPNTVKCYYFRRLGGIPRVFVEYVKGEDLGKLIQTKELYEGGHEAALARMFDMAIQFAWGLNHAHCEGVIHQDVKPKNVLVSKDGQVKVTDFGLARVLRTNRSGAAAAGGDATRGPSGGTAHYRSPDHERFGKVTQKTDIWSWGVSLIEMFSGRLFWAHGREAPQVLSVLIEDNYRFKAIPPMPDAVADLLRHCFELDPKRRPESMLWIADELTRIYAKLTGNPYEREAPATAATTTGILNNRAVSLLDLGRSLEAERLWAEVLESEPGHVWASYNRDLNLWRTGRMTDAELVGKLHEACSANPDGWLPRYFLARVLMERGDSTAAIKVLEGITIPASPPREVAYSLAIAQNIVANDKRLMWEFPAHSTPVTAVCLSFDGWRSLTGSAGGKVSLWETATGRKTAAFEGHEGAVSALCLSEDEKIVLSAGEDGTLRVWDPISGECTGVLTGHTAMVRSAALNRKGTRALSGSRDHTLKLWDLPSGECLRTFEGHEAAVNSVAYSRCGGFALSGSRDQTLKLWNVKNGECVRTMDGDGGRVTSVCLSADRSFALSAEGTKVKTWDLESGKLIRSFRGHQSEIHAISLSEDGHYALSATRLGTIKVWDIRTGQCIRSLPGQAPISLGRDGRFAISGAQRGKVKVWTVNCDETPLGAPFMLCREEAQDTL